MPLTLAAPRLCIVRGVSTNFERCLRDVPCAIDVERARVQHRGYVELLREIADEVVELAPHADYPDSCYVEDVAVGINRYCVVTRPGAPSRRGI